MHDESANPEAFLRRINPRELTVTVPSVTVADLDDGGAPWPTARLGTHVTPDGRAVVLVQPAGWDAATDGLPPLRALHGPVCVGLAHPTADGVVIQVAEEYQRLGIGGALFAHYWALQPGFESGGLTAAGRALVTAAHRRLTAAPAGRAASPARTRARR